MDTTQQIEQLANQINQARHHYYNGESQISDITFDTWIDQLAKLDPKNLAIIGIGAEPVSNWEKFAHLTSMGSLNKASTYEEYSHWHNKYSDNKPVFITTKLDGLSISLIYEKGILVRGVTRGNGVSGEDILPNVAKMKNVPLRLSQPIDATIRGEILLAKETLTKEFPDYSNTRNAASGISRRYDGEGCQHLSVLVYHVITDYQTPTTYTEQFQLLTELGFITPPFYMCRNIQEVVDLRDQYQNKLRDQFAFDLDGLVVHNDSLQQQEKYGSHNNRPYASIAFKFENEGGRSNLKDIVWQTKSQGRVSPVAIVEPVEVMGVEIERASLYNYSYIEDLQLDIGATVLVVRCNDVIPRIEEVIEGTGTTAQPPTHCPECQTLLEMHGEYLICNNSANCPAQIHGRIANWIGELDIKEWGDKLISKLIDSGKVSSIPDLYKLTVKDLSSLERMGQKSAQKAYDLLWATTQLSLDVFLGSLSIPLTGRSTIKTIMNNGIDTLEKMRQASVADFEKVPGIGPARAQSLHAGLTNNKEMISLLLSGGIIIETKQEKTMNSEETLVGISFVMTGKMQNVRAELEKMAINKGAEIHSSVNKGTTYLVIADPQSTSTKAEKARKLGTKLISEEQFLTMVQ